MLTLVLTDGEADDWAEFEPILEKADAKHVIVVAIVGHGDRHDATLPRLPGRGGEEQGAGQVRQGARRGGLVRLGDRPRRDRADLVTLVS